MSSLACLSPVDSRHPPLDEKPLTKYTPAYTNNLPQVGPIFPQSLLKKVKVENPKTGRKDIVKYKEAERNQLANCMLLTAPKGEAATRLP